MYGPPQRLNQSAPETFISQGAIAPTTQEASCPKWLEDNHECTPIQTDSDICCTLEAVDIACRSRRAEELSKRAAKL
jgi:hypothetical protein